MHTLIQEDAPHPLSYRPDLPLRSELNSGVDVDDDRYSEGWDAGHEEGLESGREEGRDEGIAEMRATIRRMSQELDEAQRAIDAAKDIIESDAA